MAAGGYRELQEGSKGRRGWQDKGRYGLVVGLDYFSTSYPASISARCLTAPLGIGSSPVPPRMAARKTGPIQRSEEHTSELQSLMRISYAVFCLKKKK